MGMLQIVLDIGEIIVLELPYTYGSGLNDKNHFPSYIPFDCIISGKIIFDSDELKSIISNELKVLRPTKDILEFALKLTNDNNMQAARMLGISKRMMIWYRSKFELPIRGVKHLDLTNEQLIELFQQHKTMLGVSKILNCSHTNLRSYLRKIGFDYVKYNNKSTILK